MCRIHEGNFGKCARNYKCHWVYVYMLEVPYCAGNVSETLNLLCTGMCMKCHLSNVLYAYNTLIIL